MLFFFRDGFQTETVEFMPLYREIIPKEIVPLISFDNNGIGIKLPTEFEMQLNKETKTKPMIGP